MRRRVQNGGGLSVGINKGRGESCVDRGVKQVFRLERVVGRRCVWVNLLLLMLLMLIEDAWMLLIVV